MYEDPTNGFAGGDANLPANDAAFQTPRPRRPRPQGAAVRNYHENDQLANSRSNYRRTSSRYTSKSRKGKKALVTILIVLAVLLAIFGALFGLAHWAGLFKFQGEGSQDDTTLVSLHNKGNEALLPAVNVDTLLRAISDSDAAAEGLKTFNTAPNKDFILDDEAQVILEAAIAQAEDALRRNPVTTSSKPAPAEDGDPDGEDAENPQTAADDDAEGQPDGAEDQDEGIDYGDDTVSAPIATAEDDGIDRRVISLVAIDLTDGEGIVYNLDGFVYGGGSIKALFATYFASQFLDSAKASEEVDGQRVIQALSTTGDGLYEQLRRAYNSYGWDAWIGGIGAKSSISSAGYYPSTSARMQTKAWLNVYRYLTGRTAYATWLATQLESGKASLTTQAFGTGHTITAPAILDEEGNVVEGGEEVTYQLGALGVDMLTWSFGAGLNDPATGQYCIIENAIVLVDGKAYLFTVMTGLADTNTNREVVASLLAAAANAIVEVPEPQIPEDEPVDDAEVTE